jgi:tetratricopeptide (TPR) repeat protein
MDNIMWYSTFPGRASQCGLVLSFCLGLLCATPNLHAQRSGAGAASEPEAADRAYAEAAAKNFTAAIKDFRNALAEDPSNAIWRKDLGFACLGAGFPEDAAAEFTRVYSEHPEDLGVALQLGYLWQQLRRDEDAAKYFAEAARSADPEVSKNARKALEDLRAAQLLSRKQKGYDLLAANRTYDAVSAFESIHADDPSDMNVTLQLGYLYAAARKTGEAKAMFTEADNDADPKIALQASAGLEEVRRDDKVWFASVYAAPFYQSRFSNEINPLNAKIGLTPSPYFQPYIGLRFSRDVRSQAGELPQIFSDNSAVISIGVQSALGKTGVVVYAEAGTAVHLISERPRAASDYRVGIVWSRPWGAGLFAADNLGRTVSLTGSAYADAGYYTRYNHDFIGNVQLREGINLPIFRALPMQLFAATNLIRDSNRNFYNNVVEVGPVLRVAPLRHLPSLTFEAQYLRGFYTAHDPTNPYGSRYGDFRVLLIWSRTF